MRVIAQVEGIAIPEWLRARPRLAAQAVTAAMDAAGKGLQQDMRRQIAGAGMGRRLGNAVRQATYPKPPRASLGAASEIRATSNAADIIRSFEEGLVIHAKGHRYLAIPTPAIPRGRWGAKLSPKEAEMRFGQKLEYRLLGGRPALVLPQARLSHRSGARAATTRQIRRGQAMEVVAYWLVEQARMPKRLNGRQLVAGWMGRLPGMIDRIAAGLRG